MTEIRLTDQNQLMPATAEDLRVSQIAIVCGENHPWDCRKLEAAKLLREYEQIIQVEFVWLRKTMAICDLLGQA